jgi:hypothetical protein
MDEFDVTHINLKTEPREAPAPNQPTNHRLLWCFWLLAGWDKLRQRVQRVAARLRYQLLELFVLPAMRTTCLLLPRERRTGGMGRTGKVDVFLWMSQTNATTHPPIHWFDILID